MTFEEYFDAAWATAIYPDRGSQDKNVRTYAHAGLIEEAGEFNGKVKRAWRKDHGEITPETRKAMLLELGDVLWYAVVLDIEEGGELRRAASILGWPPNEALPEVPDTLWFKLAAIGRVLARAVYAGQPSFIVSNVMAAAVLLGSSIEEVAQLNIEKLRGRKERGTLQGEGDGR